MGHSVQHPNNPLVLKRQSATRPAPLDGAGHGPAAHHRQRGGAGVVRLTEVFRQAAHSRIITTEHRINEGQMPETPAREAESDFYFIDRAEPEQIAATLVERVKTRIPAKFRFDPIRDIQVLRPMNRGSLGIRELKMKPQGELKKSHRPT